MQTSSLFHLTDGALRRDMIEAVARARMATARVVAHLAEFDARRLYAAEGYPSMRAFCMQELRFSEHAAFRRIRAARTARQFPAVLPALTDGRLHLTAVVLLTPHLTPENADELIAAATHRSRAEIEQLLAERFPQSDLPDRVARP